MIILAIIFNNMNRSFRPSKKDLKSQKYHEKQDPFYLPRKVSPPQPSKSNTSSATYNKTKPNPNTKIQQPSVKRAIRWWQRIDEKYFKPITLEDALNKRDVCTSNQLLMVGDGEVSCWGHYREEMVEGAGLGGLMDQDKIRVIFRSKGRYQAVVAVYGVETAIANYNNDIYEDLDEQGIKVISKTQAQRILQQSQYPTISQLKQIRLQLEQYQDNQIICQRLQKMEQLSSNPHLTHQIDKQLALWQWQLQRTNRQNHINWNKLIKNMQNKQDMWKVRQMDEFDIKIKEYRDKLYWATVLRSFQHGFKDKTKKMLQTYMQNQKNFNMKPPKGLQGHHQKKFFQTDCKICFCSDNNDSNQVLYCDSCNTSFHLICYGLTSIPQEEQYFCERCTYMRRQQTIQGAKLKKPYCQICLKTSFPMKKLDDHFYHVTCLILFNFVEFRDNKMVLKGSLAHENILKMVIQNEIMHQQCNQCRKIGGGTELGMQIKCNYEGCQNYCHPICGYLNGYKFDLKITKNKSLEVKMFCNDHLGSRVEQIYLRRYMCNLNETSSKSEKQIKNLVENQQQALIAAKETIQKMRRKYPNRILIMTKFIKNLLKSRSQKGQQQIQTETQAILKRLKNKQSI